MKLIALTLLTAALWAQEAKPMIDAAKVALMPPPRQTTRVIEFILDDGEKMRKIASLFEHRLQRIQVEPSVGLLVMTGWEKDVNEVEEAIKRYYKPKPLEAGISGPPNRNIELVLNILQASSTGNQADVPAPMQPIVQQLKQLTSLTSFRLIESQILRTRSGQPLETSGMLPWPGAPEASAPNYSFSLIVQPKGVLLQCDKLHFRARIPFATSPDKFQYNDVSIYTYVDLKPGQATVIGKTNTSLKDGSLILVLTAKLVD